jgi:glycerol-3-phosphate acyltransferase PlsY
MLVARITCLVIGYCLGLFQTGYFYGKFKHVDIREHGSGNAGATNTLRTLGLKAGAIAFGGDLGKALAAMLIGWLIFHNSYQDSVKVLQMYAGLGAVLGHNFPFYMKFKGGKGIACTSGFILAFHWQIAPLCLLLFILIVAGTRYVSLGSVVVVISFFTQLVIFGQMGWIAVGDKWLFEIYIVGAVFTLLALYMHRANIIRLLKGTENKIGANKKE